LGDARVISMRAYTVPVATPAELDARISLSVNADNRPFDLTGSTVYLEIWDTRSDDVMLYSASDSDSVITVGEEITVTIPPDTALYSDLEAGYKYRYGLTVVHPSLDFRVQGAWQILRKYGPADAGPNDWTLSTTDQTITINGGTGPKGDQGLIGPAGPWEAESRVVTATGAILPTDTIVLAQAGGADIVLSCPAAADLWDGVNGRVIIIARLPEDTGTVIIIGSADGLPIELFSSDENLGESVYITTTDGITLIVDDAPFVVQAVISQDALVQSASALSSLSGHRIVYGNDGFDYADKDTPSTLTAIVGMTISAAASGDQVTVVSSGIIKEPTWDLSFPGRVFLGNDGQITQAAPADGSLVAVGKAISKTEMIVSIEDPIILI
jgi:hypothetical protein